MLSCSNCGAAAPPEARFCGACGTVFQPDDQVPTLNVPRGEPPARPWWRSVPGFRTGVRWKQVVASVLYGLVALVGAIWLVVTPLFGIAFFAVALAGGALATNAWGVRSRVPVLNSSNRAVQAGGWVGVVLFGVIALGLGGIPYAEDPEASAEESQTATRTLVGDPVTPSDTPATALTAVASPSPSPSPTPSPQPTPTVAPTPTPAPTPAPATPMPSPVPPASPAPTIARTPTPVAQSGRAQPQGTACPPEYPIKGNHSSSGEWIYHRPGQQAYARTQPEACFATAQDAEAAGYRAAQR